MEQNNENSQFNEQNLPSEVKFTDKNRAFCDEYLKNGGNGTQAYLVAYTGVTYNTAHSNSVKLLQKASVTTYLNIQRAEIAKLERIERSYVVTHLRKLIADCANDNDRSNLIKSLNLLSEIGGLKVEKPTVNVTTQGPVKIDFGGFDPDKPDFLLDNVQDVEHEDVDGSGVEDGLDESETNENSNDL